MAPATSLVPIHACCPSIPLTPPKDLLHTLQTRDDLLPERRKHNVTAHTTLQLHGVACRGRGQCKKVVDGFVVYLGIRVAQEVFAREHATDECKDVFHGAGNDTGLVGSAVESEGLS